jgi:hypothetical protein
MHGVHVASSEEYIIIQLGINELYIDENFFSLHLDRHILIQALCLGWSTIISLKSDGGGDQIR